MISNVREYPSNDRSLSLSKFFYVIFIGFNYGLTSCANPCYITFILLNAHFLYNSSYENFSYFWQY